MHDLSGVVAATSPGVEGWIPGDETSDAVQSSSCFGVCRRRGLGGRCFRRSAGGWPDSVDAAEEPAEQVAPGGGVPDPAGSAPVVVGAGAVFQVDAASGGDVGERQHLVEVVDACWERGGGA